jgi:2-polyprenyl-6-methoxyphenol hydroxylase-like FAD-dependent oxidoreductase
MDVTIAGAGIGGLAAALDLGRQGHRITLLERDNTPMPATADEAFEWDRRGAPQVRHSHAFLARLRNLLRDNHPDVLDALLAEGAGEIRIGDMLPETMESFGHEPDDDELVMIACRRTTFEWVLRRAVLAESGVTIRTGAVVAGLLADGGDGDVPVVTGVRLADGGLVESDLMIAATGRRTATPEWLAQVGARPVVETVEDTGIVYASRFYRLRPDADVPHRTGPIGGDLGYIKYGTFVGDNRTFSVTLAVPSDDDELRRRLSEPAAFDAAAQSLAATASWLDGRAEPLTSDVHMMARLVNKWSDYVVDSEPVAIGVIPVGDAAVCTNPLYGRGCSIAYWSAHLLTRAIGDHPADLRGVAIAYDEALRAEIRPWYKASVQQDREARRVATSMLSGEDPYADASAPHTLTRSILKDGLAPALRVDPVVLRAFFRNFNLLSPPDALLTDADFGARVLAVLEKKDQQPPAPTLGPGTRDEFLALLPVV